MSVNADAVLERSERRNDIRDLSNRTSNEVSDLLLRAISLVERDEVVAIDLMKKASSLLRPSGAKTSPAATSPPVLGKWAFPTGEPAGSSPASGQHGLPLKLGLTYSAVTLTAMDLTTSLAAISPPANGT